MRNNKGITLIALIITILVMVILAAVAISTIVGETGTMTKAEEASAKIEQKEIYENIAGLVQYNEDGTIKVKEAFENVKKHYGEDKVTLLEPTDEADIGDEVTFEVEGKKGKYTYKITKKAIAILSNTEDEPENPEGSIEPEEPRELTPLEKYILGENGEGKDLNKILNSSNKFIDDPDTEVDESTYNVKYIYEYSVSNESIPVENAWRRKKYI